MSFPELWIIAGPNGAGKTTCAQTKPILDILPDVSFFNPDDREWAKP
jgi:predicted ABC-type ATPase